MSGALGGRPHGPIAPHRVDPHLDRPPADVSQEQGATAAGPSRGARAAPVRPSNSLISTAVQPSSPRAQRGPPSPKVARANSVVSQTPYQRPLPRTGGRAGTPGSVYGQGGSVAGGLRPIRGSSPAGSLAAAEQVRAVRQAVWPAASATCCCHGATLRSRPADLLHHGTYRRCLQLTSPWRRRWGAWRPGSMALAPAPGLAWASCTRTRPA
jgi:hypothetical protein